MTIVGEIRRFGWALWLLSACSGAAGTAPGSAVDTDGAQQPELRGGPPSGQTLGGDLCVFGPSGHKELSWELAASGRTKVTLWLANRWAQIGGVQVSIDDREIKGKTVTVEPNVPHTFKLWLDEQWKPRRDDALSFDLMAQFPNGAQIHIPNSSCIVPAPPPP